MRHLPVTLDKTDRIEQFDASALLATPIGNISLFRYEIDTLLA
ncbi:hypothetical protein [Shimia abyssi]|nr:hypothetical protein [Shimia abyssi]